VQTAHLALARHRAVFPRREGTRRIALSFDERKPQPVRIADGQRAVTEASFNGFELRSIAFQPRGPEPQAVERHLEADFDRQAVADARRRHVRPRKEREIGARTPLRVRVEQVIRAGIVLIDALLDQPHAQHAGVEVQVLLRGTRDRGDVMKPVDAPHPAIITIVDWRLLIVDLIVDCLIVELWLFNQQSAIDNQQFTRSPAWT
jgi:hypothetical protein